MSTYLSTPERAEMVRKELKAKGWSSRAVSVRAERCGYSSALEVVIKNPLVPLGAVKEIADEHREVRYCHTSGEVLEGCNRYVSVRYASWPVDVLAPWAAALMPKVEAALAKTGDNTIVPVLAGYGVCKEHGGVGGVWGPEGHVTGFWTAAEAAAVIVHDLAKTGNLPEVARPEREVA